MYNHIMPKKLTTRPPLQELRLRAGLDPDEVAARVNQRISEKITPAAVISWERRGTRNVDYLEALSEIYRLPLNVISEAARHSINNLQNAV